MSRVGRKPIVIPTGVDVTIEKQTVSVKGPKGQLTCQVNPLVQVVLNEEEGTKVLTASIKNELNKQERALWGTTRALLQNLVVGVTEGFVKQLEVNGVGYRVNMQGKNLVLTVGFSHPVIVAIPELVDVVVEGNLITLKSIDKQMVGEVTANIRAIKKPEPYKGKGIKYKDEVVRRKAGKAQKSGE